MLKIDQLIDLIKMEYNNEKYSKLNNIIIKFKKCDKLEKYNKLKKLIKKYNKLNNIIIR